jgi:hypothetical protein
MKLLLEFPDALFHAVDEGSILGDDEVWSSQARCTVQNCHNFRSDRWIAIKLLLEFPDALFHVVDEESILGDDEVWSPRLDGRFEKAITFDPTVGSQSNFYWSFLMPISMEWMRVRYSVMMRSGRARLDGRLERAITFDATVGSR